MSEITAADHAYMARALQLAALGQYSTAPNPAVGCVLLDTGGVVIGEGWHRRAGEPHAEVHALQMAGDRARGGTAYVTLEPCSHHGRTPPCADALVAVGVRRVVAAMQDPNPRVAGQGIARLRQAGIEAAVGLMVREATEINRGFIARMARGRPWVTVKLGMSADGRIALADGSSQWITAEAARADVQRLRARASAVLTGIGTVLKDDPALTVRDPDIEMHGREPLRVVFDAKAQLPMQSKLATDGKSTLVFSAVGATTATSSQVADARVTQSAASSPLRTEAIALDAAGRIDIAAALRRLAELECNEVLVEAGPCLAGAFVASGLVDEIVLYVAPTLLGETAQPAFALPQPLRSLSDRARFKYHDVRQVGPDLRLTLRPLEN
jgi:diaminohydroxyphosphoribosylaminopyrimidine deaminase/5-amino-6-(5-phosphoribosylamino)uracil reductase